MNVIYSIWLDDPILQCFDLYYREDIDVLEWEDTEVDNLEPRINERNTVEQARSHSKASNKSTDSYSCKRTDGSGRREMGFTQKIDKSCIPPRKT